MVYCGNISVSSTFVSVSSTIIERISKLWKECQLNRAKPREVKDNSYNSYNTYKLSKKTNGKGARHSCYLSPH